MCEVLAEPEDDVISVARATKDAQEVACIRRTCRLTIGETRDYLRGHRLVGKTLYTPAGQPLTVADVKRFICMRAFALMRDCIFAIGRDAGVPHSSGTPDAPITISKTIIFDIFPRDLGGYHYANLVPGSRADPHRAGPRAGQSALQHGGAYLRLQRGRVRFVRGKWLAHHSPGLRHDPRLRAWLRPLRARSAGHQTERPDEKFQVGSVFCSEYDPDDPRGGWGVRIEDNYYCNPDGHFERLTNFDHNLVVLLS